MDGSAEKLRAELLAEKRDTIAEADGVRPEDLDDQMVRCHCFLKNHNLLNPRRQGAIPGCSPWISPVLPLTKVFLLVDNLPIIIHWCFILREENEGAGEEEERTGWRF